MTPYVTRDSFFGLSHYECGEAYFGSFRGMRYRLAREPLKDVRYASGEEKAAGTLLASVWPEPYSYAATDNGEITDHTFPFSEEGMEEAVRWINESYASAKDRWEALVS
ncbi:MAG: hypothetical protein IJQ12_04605 [Lachnospiraceae bacterium]|nr:hypothetical protein [Lachnospiraceae bacterium]